MRGILLPAARLLRDRRGVTALEYGMMAALIVLVAVAAVTRLGSKVLSFWNTVTGLHF